MDKYSTFNFGAPVPTWTPLNRGKKKTDKQTTEQR